MCNKPTVLQFDIYKTSLRPSFISVGLEHFLSKWAIIVLFRHITFLYLNHLMYKSFEIQLGRKVSYETRQYICKYWYLSFIHFNCGIWLSIEVIFKIKISINWKISYGYRKIIDVNSTAIIEQIVSVGIFPHYFSFPIWSKLIYVEWGYYVMEFLRKNFE